MNLTVFNEQFTAENSATMAIIELRENRVLIVNNATRIIANGNEPSNHYKSEIAT
jgi:hypothetical protein